MRKAGCAPHCSNAAGQPWASERRLSFRKCVFGGAHWGGGCSALAPLLCSGLLLGGGRCPVPPRHGLPAAPPVPLSDPELDALPPGPPLHFPHSQLLQVTVCFAGWAENLRVERDGMKPVVTLACLLSLLALGQQSLQQRHSPLCYQK